MVKSATANNAIARILSGALRVVPPGRHTFVHGVPGTEGNLVEVVRMLVRLTGEPITWPGAPSAEYLEGVGIQADRVRRLPSAQSISAVWAFLRARAVFHTHGIYGNPVPSPRRPIVNIWHGDGFKGGLFFPERTLRGPSATYLVSTSRLIGELKAGLAKLPISRLLIVGNPRIAQMFSPPAPSVLETIGIDPNRPFVLWMPTFRVARDSQGGIAWSNTINPATDQALAQAATRIALQLHKAGINLVIKPHRLDAASRAVPGAVIISDSALEEHSIPLYGLIGASAGLISDLSSVWIDYLALDRPIGFLINDLDDFSQGRDVMAPELISRYPGEWLDSDGGIARFAEEVTAGGKLRCQRRAEFKQTIGFVGAVSGGEEVVRVALNL